MPLQHLPTPAAAADWLRARLPAGAAELVADSRCVRPGAGFFAWPGASSDARRFVPAALQAGAAACLVDAEGVQAFGFDDDERIAALPGLKAAAGTVADSVLGAPSAQLEVLAVTGTNGKTSTAWWLAQALTLLGRPCGLIGTLGVGQPPVPAAAGQGDAAAAAAALQDTGLTTPDALTVHGAMRRFVDAGLGACALEASSIGLVDHRLTALRIDVALFSNFTRDHLDVHGTMAAYWAAKRRLFSWPGLRAAVINLDDAQGAQLAAELQGQLALWTVSCTGAARLAVQGLRHTPDGMSFVLTEHGGGTQAVRTALVGSYNASNLALVAGGLRALGLPLEGIAQVLGRLQPVPGRLQRVQLQPPTQAAPGDERQGGGQDVEVLVDYAHTPDALDQVLQALRPLADARGGRLVCVFGCGGNRDATKRPLMGRVAEQRADQLVLTSDNPRLEDPLAILAQISAGLQQPAGATVEPDRRAAIRHAILDARPGDVVLLAGKGHEDYQDAGGSKRPFSDMAEARAALQQRRAMQAGAGA